MSILQILHCLIQTHFMTTAQKDLEILALRSQLAIVQQQCINKKLPRPRLSNTFRRLWVLLSKIFINWSSALVLVKPETVISWRKRAFKSYWRRKSKGGRPKISWATIVLIRKIHRENPLLSPEKIHEQLCLLNIADVPAPNTIAKYIHEPRTTPTEKQKQSWQTFLRNHATGIWAMDFAVVPTLTFKPLYVLLIISHHRRRIEHFSVTRHPTAEWLIQQIREATFFGKRPKYLIHDNDSTFIAQSFQHYLIKCHIASKRTAFHSPWQNGICERLVGIIRRELLDHIIPLNQRHLERLLTEYVNYYNKARTHQSLNREPPDLPERPKISRAGDTVLESTPILGGLYHSYKKVS